MLSSSRTLLLRRLPLSLPHAHLPSPAFSDSRRRTNNPTSQPPLTVVHSRTTALFHTTAMPHSATALAGLAGVALIAQVVRQGAIAYDEFSKQTPEDATSEEGGGKSVYAKATSEEERSMICEYPGDSLGSSLSLLHAR